MKLHIAIRKIVESQGKDYLCSKKFINALNDYQAFEADSAEKNVMRILLHDGYIQKFLECHSCNVQVLNLCWEIEHYYGIKGTVVKHILEEIADGLGYSRLLSSATNDVALTNHLNTSVSIEDIQNSVEDEYGCKYSKDGLKLIKANATLQTYEIKAGTMIICDQAFKFCSLQTIYIPNSVTTIGNFAFAICKMLERVYLPESVTSLGHHAFWGCFSIETICIPEGVTCIGKYTFQWCKSLKNINMSNSVSDINHGAFCGCKALESFRLPSNVTRIEDATFAGCASLKTLDISEKITEIGNNPFSGCEQLTLSSKSKRFIVNDNVLYDTLKARLICCLSKKIYFEIPDTVMEIGDSAFRRCDVLKYIYIPNSVTSIGHSAFEGCTSLKTVDIPDSVTHIKSSAFSDCTSLKSAQISNSITNMDMCVFFKCVSLETIHIPNSIIKIEPGYFDDCTSLKRINIPNSIKDIIGNPFAGCEQLTLSSSSMRFIVKDNVLYDTLDDRLICCLSRKSSFIIPSCVKKIGYNAFKGCLSLKTVHFLSDVEEEKCYLLNGFWGCKSVETIYIPLGTKEKFQKLLPENLHSILIEE